jgi:hypothetical protein
MVFALREALNVAPALIPILTIALMQKRIDGNNGNSPELAF